MNLLKNGQIVVKNRVYNESELSIRSVEHVVYPADMRYELIVTMAVRCDIGLNTEASDDDWLLSSVFLTLDQKGNIKDTGYELSQPPCHELRQNIDNQHITHDLNVEFENEFMPSQAPIKQISKHINQLAKEGQLNYGGFPLSTHHFELLSITFNELLIKDHHSIQVHLTLSCGINNTEPGNIASPFKVMFFLYPNGETSELYGYHKGEFNTNCSH